MTRNEVEREGPGYVSGGDMRVKRAAQENAALQLPADTMWVRFTFVDHAGIPKGRHALGAERLRQGPTV